MTEEKKVGYITGAVNGSKKNGDLIEIDVPHGRLDLKVSQQEIEKRLAKKRKKPDHPADPQSND